MHAGIRTEPAVSLPKASNAEPSIRLTPAPLREPPWPRCAAGRAAGRTMRGRVPRVVGHTPMAVATGPSERELDHMGLAHDDAELAAQRRHQGAVPFPRISR